MGTTRKRNLFDTRTNAEGFEAPEDPTLAIGTTKLFNEDLRACINNLPGSPGLQFWLENLLAKGFYIGGGFVRAVVNREPVADLDIFGGSRSELEAASQELVNIFQGSIRYVTQNAITVRIPGVEQPIQFILPWTFTDPTACMANFDFTICRAVIYFNHDTQRFDSVIDRRFYKHCADKKLVYCRPEREEDAAGSFLRAQKFIARGYKIQPFEWAKLLARLVAGTVMPQRGSGMNTTAEAYEEAIQKAIHSTMKKSTKRRMGY